MNYKLCIAEKPSVAKDIALVVGANHKKNGYYIGSDYIVTWAIGHLITLAEPEEYNDDYKDRSNISLLPILPSYWKYSLIEDVKNQFYIIKDLMERSDVDLIIDCGDMGETGHYLQWLIRMYAGCNKPVKRFCATSLTNESIKHHMSNLRDINDFEGIIEAASCKAKGDWIIGMNFSRLFSSLYKTNLVCGRVQTPTLYFVVKRYFESLNFKSMKTYDIELLIKDNIKFSLSKKTIDMIPKQYKDDENRIIDKKYLEGIVSNIASTRGLKITNIDKSIKTTDRPKLYDITELQRDGNKLYDYTASEVLGIAQSLYEKHKLLTYPRTDSRFITNDLVPYMKLRLKQIASIKPYTTYANTVLSEGALIDKMIVNDSKVTDHHAILVTENINNFDMSSLNEKEINILHLVISRMLVSFSPKYVYEEQTLEGNIGSYYFETSYRFTLNQGWKYVNNMLLNITEKESLIHKLDLERFDSETILPLHNIAINEKTTTAPLLHTQASLLTCMENAGATLDNEYKFILKGRGLGTQATRADIIDKLYKYQYVHDLKKKNVTYIVPTQKGINAVKIFPNELLSPKLTALWEIKLLKIAQGELSSEDFFREFNRFVTETIKSVKESNVETISFSEEKEEIAKCLLCGHSVVEGSKNYYCTNKECNWFISKHDNYVKKVMNKQLSSQMLKKAMLGGYKTSLINRNGMKYNAIFNLVINQEKCWTEWKMKFDKNK